MNQVALLIGGNQGDRRRLIQQATELIRQRIGTVVAVSSDYETEPWGDFEVENGKGRVANFLNRALLVETTLSPWQVLRTYHSRPMDIDLIFFNDEVIDTPDLQIPHPRMHLRRFVLEPLSEIMPDYRHPVSGKTIKEMLDEI